MDRSGCNRSANYAPGNFSDKVNNVVNEKEIDFIVSLIMEWIEQQLGGGKVVNVQTAF